ncbi:MAG: hypothetical protein ABH859_01865 [Pseudomonadota bacterium]
MCEICLNPSLDLWQCSLPERSLPRGVSTASGPDEFISASGRTPGRIPGSGSLTLGLLAGSAAIVAYDRFALEPLVDYNILPVDARGPALITSIFVSHQALYRAGLVDISPAQSLPHLPTFFGFQFLCRLVLELIGLDPSSALSDFAALSLAAMPFFLARQSPVLAQALGITAAHTPEALAAVSGLRSTAALRTGVGFTRWAGNFALADLGARIVVWGVGQIYADEMQHWNLVRLSQDVYNQQHAGLIMGSTFGMSFTAMNEYLLPHIYDPILETDYRSFYHQELANIRSDLISGSRTFGQQMETIILALLAQNTYLFNGESLNNSAEVLGNHHTQAFTLYMEPDWNLFQQSLNEFYQAEENSEQIANGYDLIRDYTGVFAPDAAQIENLINRSGTIRDLEGLQNQLRHRLQHLILEKQLQITTRAMELGIAQDLGNNRIVFNPAMMNLEQEDFLTGQALQLTMEIFIYQALLDVLPCPGN